MPLLLRFFLPFLLANLLNSIYNTVDTIIIGRLVGSTGIVAVTLGGKMLYLYTYVGMAFAGGGQILVSQLIGAKQENELNSAIGTLFTEMCSLSVIFAAVTIIFSRGILTLLNTPAESFDQALAYLRITSAGLPLIFGYNAVCSVLRGMGDSRNPLLFIAIAAVVNLVGDIVFIVRFNLGAAGTAYATVIGQGVSLAFSLALLYRKRELFHFDFKAESFIPDARKFKKIFRLGYPVALKGCFIAVTQLVLISFVNSYGITQAAAYSIGDKLVQLTNIFHQATKHAGGSMSAQNFGAGRHDRVKNVVRDCFMVSFTAALVLSSLALIMPVAVYSLFTTEEAVLAYAPAFLRVGCLIFLLSSVVGPLDTVITGTGNSGLSLLGGVLDGVVFRLTFSWLFIAVVGMDVVGFYLADALARLGPISVSAIYYFSGAWKRRK